MAAPLPTPEPEAVSSTESPLEVPPPQEEIPLVKPKTTRRKKAETTPATDPSATKRRGRKKADPQPEPEITPVVESQPLVAAEPVITVEPEPVNERSKRSQNRRLQRMSMKGFGKPG
jgi:hypothetical protein